MPLCNLEEREREVVKQCLRAAVESPFFPDWEFQTLFGVERDKVKSVLELWPDVDDNEETVQVPISASFNNLLGYPHGCENQWLQFISVSDIEVSEFSTSGEVTYSPPLEPILKHGVSSQFLSDGSAA